MGGSGGLETVGIVGTGRLGLLGVIPMLFRLVQKMRVAILAVFHTFFLPSSPTIVVETFIKCRPECTIFARDIQLLPMADRDFRQLRPTFGGVLRLSEVLHNFRKSEIN